ncbi:MAG: DUF58 domain-containing protein [Thermoproteota archaeon]
MPTSLRLTKRGRGLSSVTLVLAALSMVFRDPVMLAAAALLLVILLTTLASLLLKARRLVEKSRVFPEEARVETVAGRVESIEITVENPGGIGFRIEHPLSFVKPAEPEAATNKPIRLEAKPQLAGVYSSKTLRLMLKSPLEAFECTVETPFKTSIRVMPRIIPALVKAIELASAMGATVFEHPVQILGRGTEYAETREYVPGDDIRFLDWKATARLQRLMVKQYHQETGGATQIIYDLKTPGPVSRDRVATEFLNAATALASLGVPCTIITVDGENRMLVRRHRDARTMLYTAIMVALSTVDVDYTLLYDVLEPQSRRRVEEFLSLVTVGGWESEAFFFEKPGEGVEEADTIAVTSLTGDLTWLMEACEKLEKHSKRMMLRVPGETWLDSKTLEQAYKDYEKQLRIVAQLRRRGVEVSTRV